MTAAEPLLTREEMREALNDRTSPRYLDSAERHTILAIQVDGGEPIDRTFAFVLTEQHNDRAALLAAGLRGPLQARAERGDFGWWRP